MGTKTMKGCTAGLSVAEIRTEVAHERINPDALDGLCVAMEGIEQDGAIRVASVPVFGQASADQAEGARGEVATGNPRQDEEAGVIDDEVQMALALLAAPADGLIARLGFPGAGAEAEHGDDFSGGAHEVAQLRAGQGLM